MDEESNVHQKTNNKRSCAMKTSHHLKKRQQTEDEMEEITEELKNKHASKYSLPKLRCDYFRNYFKRNSRNYVSFGHYWNKMF